jgi:hypothetical protein
MSKLSRLRGGGGGGVCSVFNVHASHASDPPHSSYYCTYLMPQAARDGILGHHLDDRLEFLLSTGGFFLKKTRLLSGFKIYKKSAKQENSRLFMNSIL